MSPCSHSVGTQEAVWLEDECELLGQEVPETSFVVTHIKRKAHDQVLVQPLSWGIYVTVVFLRAHVCGLIARPWRSSDLPCFTLSQLSKPQTAALLRAVPQLPVDQRCGEAPPMLAALRWEQRPRAAPARGSCASCICPLPPGTLRGWAALQGWMCCTSVLLLNFDCLF